MVRRTLLIAAISVLGLGVLAASFHSRSSVEKHLAQQIHLARQEAAVFSAQAPHFSERAVPSGLNITDFLQGLGVARAAVLAVVDAARPVYDLARIRAGNQMVIARTVAGELLSLRYQIDPDRMLWVSSRGSEFRAEIKEIPSTTATVRIHGEIRDSLFNAVEDAGERAELAIRLSEIFGWDLDFYTDPRKGDTFRVIVEKKTYSNGQPASYGKLYAAEYNNDGTPYQAVLFRDPDGRAAYYAPDGKSLQKAFLRSPLKFSAPITSHFSKSRFHPILKIRRPHLGIDYAAPVGAPVQSIGDGRVVFAGRKGGAGNMVHIKHTNGYETMYMHLSRILARSGAHVGQGERIGLVGSTGLATGPHLDFRILQHGAYRNFESLRLPPANPVAKRDMAEFIATRDRFLPLLTADPSQLARATAPLTSVPAGR
ncbi:MAG: peptidoglycan DD-metalloendopeptidase family protein [Acidobacteria bacterium]|nr:peptidoglycan DD-metalloendopeptidase family protein [Acidobacteriota bacterium]